MKLGRLPVEKYSDSYKSFANRNDPTNIILSIHGSWNREKAHPYFGFSLDSDWRVAAKGSKMNNFGFRNSEDFPYKKSPNEFVVGIFGGSVAHFFANQEQYETHFSNLLTANNASIRGKKLLC